MNITISEAADAWMAHLTTMGLKPDTVEVYRRDLAKFVDFLGGDKDLAAITVLRINGYVRSNRLLKSPAGKALAKPTVERSRRVCRMWLEWMASAGHITDLPAGAISVFKP